MGLTPERRKELRRLAAEHQEKQRVGGTDVKAAPAIPEKEARKQPEAQQEVTPDHVTDNNASVKPATSLFPEFETEKPKEEPLDLLPVRLMVCWSRTIVTARWCWTLHAISAT